MKPRDIKENIRLSKIASAFCNLANLQQLVKENPEHATFLNDFFIIPIKELKNLSVDKARIKEFIANNTRLPLQLQFVESFRQTESRRFWE